METSDLLKKVRKIEIKTRGLSSHIFSGEYHSAFKGRGMAFNEVREYTPGDEIRTIDWNVTARFNHPYVKIYEEERELTVMLIVDVSGSNEFGTRMQFKQEIITEICAVLAFSAIQNNDKVGILFFSDIVEKFIPPKKGRSHILRIIRELIDFKPKHKRTNIEGALRYFTNAIKKRSTAFLLSDFMDRGFESALKIANKKHDIVAVKIYDKREEELPPIGLVKFSDAETGEIHWIDTSNDAVRNTFRTNSLQHEQKLKDTFIKSGVDYVKIATNESYVKPLMNMFKRREK